MGSIVEFHKVTKSYGKAEVLKGLDLDIPANDFTVIYGLPSSGKSVLLRLLMGLESPDAGDILLRGQDVQKRPPNERNLGYIPQDFALFPQKTIFENIAYPLRLMRRPDEEIKSIVRRAVEMLSIDDLLQKLPTQLSGGQKQRVAIARGIVKETDIYVFDDPLAGLDFKLRERLFDDLKLLQERLSSTFIYTTSDPLETLSLATTVTVLHEGRVQEIGPPEELYMNPGMLSTMEILGFPSANTISGTLVAKDGEAWCETELFSFQVERSENGGSGEKDERVVVGVRAENLTPVENGESPLEAEVFLREDLGAEEIVTLDFRGKAAWTMVQTDVDRVSYDLGDIIGVHIESNALFVFNAQSGRIVGRGKGRLHV